MYQFSGRLKKLSIALMVIGALGVVYGFLTVPKTAKEAMEMLASDGHGDDHGDTKDTHAKADEHNTVSAAHGSEHGEAAEHDEHAEHVFHMMQNRPWAAFYVALVFFLGISLVILAFYGAQRVAQAGWSIVIFRVWEAISANLVPTSIIMALFILLSGFHLNHLFTWMGEGVVDPSSPNYDPIVAGKQWWLNTPG